MKNIAQNQKFSFGYSRYSDDAQSGNSSLERQNIVAKISAEKGWIVREDLNITQEAISAFKKENFPVLRAIIEDAKSGKIPQGTVMVIEAFDRFSRADLDTAEDLFKQVLRAGVEIYIARGSHHMTKESLNKPIDRIIALIELAQANEYSQKLSDRVKAAITKRQNQMLNNEVLTLNQDKEARKDCPEWLDNDGKVFIPNGKAEIVAGILNDYLADKGAGAMVRKFNADGVKNISYNAEAEAKKIKFNAEAKANGKKLKRLNNGLWHQSIIHRILSDRRIIGEVKINGKVIKGYYPAIVDKNIFDRVQSKLADNAGKRVRTGSDGKVKFLFGSLGFCTCGAKLFVANSKGGVQYVSCYGKRDGTTNCNAPMVKYQPFEDAALHVLRLNPSQLLSDDNSVNAAAQVLRGRKIETEKQIADTKAGIAHCIKAKNFTVLDEINAELEALNTQLAEIESQIEMEAAKTVSNQTSMERLTEVIYGLHNVRTDNTVRVKVQQWFREQVNRITFDRKAGEFTVDLRNGQLITMDLCCNIKGTKSLTALFGITKGNVPVIQAKTA